MFTIGDAVLAEPAAAFAGMLCDEQVVAGFDWAGWMEVRGRELAASRGLLADASLEDCRRLLAALVGADRFHEGTLLGAFEDGFIDAILARLDVLVAHAQALADAAGRGSQRPEAGAVGSRRHGMVVARLTL